MSFPLSCQLIVAGIFALAVIGKLRDFDAFVGSVAEFRLVPRPLERPAARAVVSAEASVAVLVAIPATAIVGLSLAAASFLVFGIAVASVLRRGVPARCRCFGGKGIDLRGAHIARNVVLAAFAGIGAIVLAVAPDTPLTLATSAPSAFLAVAVVAVVAMFDDLVEILAPPRSGVESP